MLCVVCCVLCALSACYVVCSVPCVVFWVCEGMFILSEGSEV